MKKIIFVLSLLLFQFQAFANDGFSFKLKDYYKLEKTISMDIENSSSLHIAIAKNKNTGNYDMLPFYMDREQQIKGLTPIPFNKEPELLSFHINNNMLTLVSFQDETLSVDDFDLTSNAHQRKEFPDSERPETVFKTANETLLFTADVKNHLVSITQIANTATIEGKTLDVPTQLQDKFKAIFKETPEVVQTNEFVKNGSISKLTAYYGEGVITMIYDEADDRNMETLSIDTKNSDTPFELKKYTSPEMDKLKNSNSYLKDNDLFVINSGKSDVQLNVFDTKNGEQKKSISLKNNLANISAETAEDFINGARKNRMKPTVTVNKTTDGNLAVRLDYVDTRTYTYYNNWWFLWHMQQMQMQQMQHMQMRSFGPSPAPYDEADFIFDLKQESHAIVFVMDENLDIQKNASTKTIYPEIDKKKYKDDLDDRKDIKNSSISFLNHEYRYMYSDKKQNMLFIDAFPLKNEE